MIAIVVQLALLIPAVACAGESTGVWTYTDDRGSLSISLSVDGFCEVAAFDAATRQARTALCRYAIDGARIAMSANRARDEIVVNQLRVEYLPNSNDLIVHGDTPRVLRRNSDHWRKD